MILRPRIAPNVAMILGGAFFTLIGFGSALALGLYAGIIFAILGFLGLFWMSVAILTLSRRSSLAITIDEDGISLPAGGLFRVGPAFRIPREVIAGISKKESIKGRFVEITLSTGDKVPIQARHYCELKTFLSHCKEYGLPTV
jgi:hypothetical protein